MWCRHRPSKNEVVGKTTTRIWRSASGCNFLNSSTEEPKGKNFLPHATDAVRTASRHRLQNTRNIPGKKLNCWWSAVWKKKKCKPISRCTKNSVVLPQQVLWQLSFRPGLYSYGPSQFLCQSQGAALPNVKTGDDHPDTLEQHLNYLNYIHHGFPWTKNNKRQQFPTKSVVTLSFTCL